MADKESRNEQKSQSKAVANQTTQQKSSGVSLPAVSPIQRKYGEDDEWDGGRETPTGEKMDPESMAAKAMKESEDMEKESEDMEIAEEFDITNDSDISGTHALPSLEDFKNQSSGGAFSFRDDLLKNIDGKLQYAHAERSSIYKYELALHKMTKLSDGDEKHYDTEEKLKEIVGKCQEWYGNALKELKGSVDKWMSKYESDKSSDVARRLPAIRSLQTAIDSELKMTTEGRIQGEVEKRERETVRDRTVFTVDEFKKEAGIWVTLPIGDISDVISSLEAFHKVKEIPGDNENRLIKISLSKEVQTTASEARSNITTSGPEFTKGLLEIEKNNRLAKKEALGKLSEQSRKYWLHLETTEEFEKRKEDLRKKREAHDAAAYAQWFKR